MSKFLFFIKAGLVMLFTRPASWQWEREKLRREYEQRFIQDY
ncbi:hypothetical protein [Pontibacter diazotrophicus]|nr:hypothetical protein [Pontibacter diazotrophicus]